MVSFESYKFKDTGYGLSHVPKNTHLIIETTLYFYYVSSDDDTEMWKYTKSTGSDVQLDVDPGNLSGDSKSRLGLIKSLWYDTTNSFIYGIDFNAGTNCKTFKIDLSDDTVTELGAIGDGNTEECVDIIIVNGTLLALIVDPSAPSYVLSVYSYAVGWGFADSQAFTLIVGNGTTHCSFACVVNDEDFYVHCTGDTLGGYMVIYDHVGGLGASIATSRLCPADRQFAFLAYDNSDYLYFIDLTGAVYTLVIYSISGNTFTDLTTGYSIALMLDRNTHGGLESPNYYEKGFHGSSSYIYQVSRTKEHLLKLQDLGLTGGATIKAITDWYLIDSSKNVYEYTESLAKIEQCKVTYEIYRTPNCKMYDDEIGAPDQVFEIFQDAGAGTYTKLFIGKLRQPIYEPDSALYHYRMKNLGEEDLYESISYTAANKTGRTCVKLMLSDSNMKFLYSSASYLKGSASMSLIWDSKYFKDNVYTVCVNINGLWYHEAKGLFHLRSYGSMDNSSLEFSFSNCLMNNYNRTQYQYNTWSLTGGWDNTNNLEYNSRSEDSAHIQQYGKLPWDGRSSFTEARSTAAVSGIAVAMKSWQGMQNNPYDITITIIDHAYVQVGQKANFRWSKISALDSAMSFCIVKNEIDFKQKSQKLTLSQNIVRK